MLPFYLCFVTIRNRMVMKRRGMRKLTAAVLSSLAVISCAKEMGPDPYDSTDFDYAYGLDHGEIVLGKKLENPYTVENVGKALAKVYPTKGRLEVETTNIYARFLPKTDAELELLDGLVLVDHPLDYAIAREGDWYHDPEVPEGEMTWMYAVVDKDYVFPDVQYEVLDECFISENRTVTRSPGGEVLDDGIDWDEVMRTAYMMTGNGDLLESLETRASELEEACPSGRITLVDKDAAGGKPVGVAGVTVLCNSFVKFAKAYTDRDGYYRMDKSFKSSVRYRLVFRNERDFSLGFNFILVPASVSTLGKSDPSGVNVTVTEDSDPRLFRRCAVSNAAYDFIGRCTPKDLGIDPPQKDIRIWIFPDVKASSAIMMHHGTVVDDARIATWLGVYAPIVTFFAPDITIGASGKDSCKDLYSVTCHEMAHACHFASVGKKWWDKYIGFILSSFLSSGGTTYGTGSEPGAGYCEIGEMWAYFIQAKMHKERYGGGMPSFGTSYWFYPQIFRYLEERGLPAGNIFEALTDEVCSRELLQTKLLDLYPAKKTVIQQVFSRYE